MEPTTIPQPIVKQEFYRSTEKFHVIACWVGILLNLAWFVSDYLVIKTYFIPFLLFRISVSALSAIILIFRKSIGVHINTCVFFLVAGIAIQNAYMWSVMDVPHFQQHAFAYIVLFIGAGMLVLWELRLSLLLVALTLVFNILFYQLYSPLTLEEFLINGGLLTLTVSIFCIFLIRTRYRLTINEISIRLALEQSRQEIERQKDTLEEKNREITDSINYARSIQQALLPSEAVFNEVFPEGFVLFQPKDIVSGDFYWVHREGDRVFYVTGDCTGHGVPGGFMTMLGLSFLEDIIVVQHIQDPGTVLDLLRDRIMATLNQSGIPGESKDGMDVTVCFFDTVKNELIYASANNDVYIVRQMETGSELLEFKADRQPCGYSPVSKPFTTHTIALQSGDCVYTFTDGFADQFGGPKGKKFRYSQLTGLITANAQLPFAQQREILGSTLTEWRGSLEQVDDVLVIGVRV